MKEGLLGDTLVVFTEERARRRPVFMLHVGLDLSRRRLDVCLVDDAAELVEHTAVPPDADGLHDLAGRLAGQSVRAVIESMTGARFVHDTLEELLPVTEADAARTVTLPLFAQMTHEQQGIVLTRKKTKLRP